MEVDVPNGKTVVVSKGDGFGNVDAKVTSTDEF